MTKPLRWDVIMVVEDGDPHTRYTWTGDAPTRDDAIREAISAYPDPTASYRVKKISSYRITLISGDPLGGS